MLESVFEEDGFVSLNKDIKYKICNFDKSVDQSIIYHSIKRAKKDAYDRELAVEKIKKSMLAVVQKIN